MAVKIGPQFSNLSNFVGRLAKTGANGVVLFNRYLEPDIDLETLQIMPQLVLSSRHELRLPLRWIAILRDQMAISLAATSGIHFPEDVIKLLLVGADVCMMTSALLKHGVDYVSELIRERPELARREWIRFGGATQGEHELRQLARFRTVGAGQLHESHCVLHGNPLNVYWSQFNRRVGVVAGRP